MKAPGAPPGGSIGGQQDWPGEVVNAKENGSRMLGDEPRVGIHASADSLGPTLGPLDCMAKGFVPPDTSGNLPPSLPFYQPKVDSSSIDSVVGFGLPGSNHFTVMDGWDGNKGIVPITTWRLSEYTGFFPGGPASSFQRGQVDSYGQSGVQLVGQCAGLWLNTSDASAVLYNGSGSINVGCWYQGGAPLASLFPTTTGELDVSFDAGVAYDGSTGNGHGQAYFQLIANDRSGGCGSHCAFTLSVSFYSRDAEQATNKVVVRDDTGTLDLPIAGAGLDATGWFRRMPDSSHYQTGAFSPQRVHFRMSQSEFVAIRNAVAANNSSFRNLSTNPLDYAVSLLNVNGEVYDPCKAPSGAGCSGSDHAQLGMSVANFRVLSTVPHQSAGAPWGFDGLRSQVLYRDVSGNINAFSSGTNGAFQQSAIATGAAAGDPMGYVAGSAPRVVFRDTSNHVRESFFWNGVWTTWDMNAGAGGANAYSDPKAYVAPDGFPRVVYRDVVGDVHEFQMDSGGWQNRNITRLSAPTPAPAIGSPRGYVAGWAPRVVFRDNKNHVREMYYWAGRWNAWDMMTIPGASDAYSDPNPYVAPDGWPHVVYRDIVGDVHEFYMDSYGWHHVDIASSTHPTPSLGSPMGFVAGYAPRILYCGTDHHLHELVSWSGWSHTDLTLGIRGAISCASDPMGYVPSDGAPRVEYTGADGQLHELYYSGGWIHRDM